MEASYTPNVATQLGPSWAPSDVLCQQVAGQPAAVLVWVTEGAQRIHTSAGVWVSSPELAVWMPAGFAREAATPAAENQHSIEFWDDELDELLPKRCCAVRVTPPLREAMLLAAHADDKERERARSLALSQIKDAGVPALTLSTIAPSARLQPLITSMLEQPADRRSRDEWAEFLRMSPRTLNRTFQREVGMSFRDWRRQTQLLHALERLAQGEEVSRVARLVGFKSVSMFIEMFRRSLGTTPGRYFAASKAPRPPTAATASLVADPVEDTALAAE